MTALGLEAILVLGVVLFVGSLVGGLELCERYQCCLTIC